ncbi:MAG: 4-hydroxythreonine-4-phosphate dehydrogenase, partial [Verrucomicrobia bacterium]
AADQPARLALTCGDPAGVGPEIIADWLRSVSASEAEKLEIHGPARWLKSLPHSGIFRSVPAGPESFQAQLGHPNEGGALLADLALRAAAASARAGEVDGVVTGPVAKSWMARIGWPYPGQTEFFAEAWGGEPVMAFCGGRLRVILATWHIPLASVPGALTTEVLARAVEAATELCSAAGIAGAARIAVCGLNPHAGEEGLLGHEERELIDPILDHLRIANPKLSRTLPGDTVFGRQLRGEFDATIALYHDQGLAPVKTLEFDQSVNVTLGLRWVRTSPDHGTGFDIAGRGLASTTSFANAVQVARGLVTKRRLRLRA